MNAGPGTKKKRLFVFITTLVKKTKWWEKLFFLKFDEYKDVKIGEVKYE